MPPGVQLNGTIDRDAVIAALKKHKGVYRQACKELNINRNSISKYVRADPELLALVNELRYAFEEDMLDACEDVITKLVKKVDEDPSHSLKASIYYLNNKGKKRGYAHPDADKDGIRMTTDQILEAARQLQQGFEEEEQPPKIKRKKNV